MTRGFRSARIGTIATVLLFSLFFEQAGGITGYSISFRRVRFFGKGAIFFRCLFANMSPVSDTFIDNG